MRQALEGDILGRKLFAINMILIWYWYGISMLYLVVLLMLVMVIVIAIIILIVIVPLGSPQIMRTEPCVSFVSFVLSPALMC